MVAFAMSPKRIYTDEERRQRANAASTRWKQNNKERFNAANNERRRNRRKECPMCKSLMKPTAKVCIKCKKGELSGVWKGGRSFNSFGYVLVVGEPNEPGLNKSGYILEHRRVMQQMLGRALRPKETVHHKNGIRHDNRPENLELWLSRQPGGQRVEDLVEWAIQILNDYAPEKLCQ